MRPCLAQEQGSQPDAKVTQKMAVVEKHRLKSVTGGERKKMKQERRRCSEVAFRCIQPRRAEMCEIDPVGHGQVYTDERVSLLWAPCQLEPNLESPYNAPLYRPLHSPLYGVQTRAHVEPVVAQGASRAAALQGTGGRVEGAAFRKPAMFLIVMLVILESQLWEW